MTDDLSHTEGTSRDNLTESPLSVQGESEKVASPHKGESAALSPSHLDNDAGTATIEDASDYTFSEAPTEMITPVAAADAVPVVPRRTEQTDSEIKEGTTASKRKLSLRTKIIAGVAAACLCVALVGMDLATGAFSSAADKPNTSEQSSRELTTSSSGTAATNKPTVGEKEEEPKEEVEAVEAESQNADSQDVSESSSPSSNQTSTNQGTGQSTPVATPEPAPEQVAPPAPEYAVVTVYIDTSRMPGYASYSSTVYLTPGASAYDALIATGAGVSGSGSFVDAINGLASFQGGAGSGWMYSVNGVSPSVSAGAYALYGGESVTWWYTLNYGND